MTFRIHGALIGALLLTPLLAACGASGGNPSSTTTEGQELQITPQQTEILRGVDRISFVIQDNLGKPVLGAQATFEIQPRGGTPFEKHPLQYIGPDYGNIPVYVGTARFPTAGEVEYAVHATFTDGTSHTGYAFQNVLSKASVIPVGHSITEIKKLRQPVASDVSGDLTKLDSAVKDGKAAPDPWHTATIQDGVDQHKPMVLYFGEPGRCVTQTCGPTVDVLTKLSAQYQDRMLFEHIEVHYPADADTFNPVYVSFGFKSEPWVFFVNKDGVISDRFEGPVTIEQLRTAADGTLAGKVPAVDVAVST